ncbi:MAG TPA: metallophosphoesterase [Sporichthyaceae bacterium]|jgi:predicted MPP superfamily phosphohydrolase|nr:metallophosphoesterase [Sporichthyaceae bacterium]
MTQRIALARAARVLGGLAAAGAGVLAYGAGYEVRAFTLRRVLVPVLPAGQRPLRVLHLSDLHMTPGQQRKRDWVRSLAALEPDLVVNTGDNMAHLDSVPGLLDAMDPLLDRPGIFVFGSNDYWSPRLGNPAKYLVQRQSRVLPRVPDLPSAQLRDALVERGWEYLGNARTRVKLDGRVLDLVGVDDPHVNRDRYPAVAGPADPAADLSMGVLHAPYRRVLDAMAADGHQLIIAGHTHGGQLQVPSFGALVTNCDLDRRSARGLTRYPDWRLPGSPWLHVSAGLGTSPYAPVRLCCRPEATLLTLTAVEP